MNDLASDSNPTWSFEHSVECPVSREFAWQFWTNVDNWMFDVSVESVALDGPFVAGTRGVTKPRGQEPIHWRLVEVQDRGGAVIEIALPGATVSFIWKFEDVANGGARITQRVLLEGERAGDYAAGMKELEQGIPQGMRKMVEEMSKAASERA